MIRTKTVAHEAIAECVTDVLMSLMNLLALYEKQQKNNVNDVRVCPPTGSKNNQSKCEKNLIYCIEADI